MSFIAVAIGGSAVLGLGGALLSSNAASNAANTQSAAEQQALGVQQGEFNTLQGDISPYLQAGSSALPQLSSMASQPVNFTSQDFLNNMDPAYGFDLGQGEQAVQRSAAAAGGLQSGGTLTALNNYAQGMASNEYQNAYSRFMSNQNTQFSRLQSVAGMGQNAVNSLGTFGSNYANAAGNALTGSANAQAAGTIGSANAWGSALGSIGSTATSLPGQIAGMNYLDSLTTANNALSAMPGNAATINAAGNLPQLSLPQLGSSSGFASNTLVSNYVGN